MLVLANLCNVGLAVFGNIYQQGNFATFLLAILMSNLILYTFFYIMMKVCTFSFFSFFLPFFSSLFRGHVRNQKELFNLR